MTFEPNNLTYLRDDFRMTNDTTIFLEFSSSCGIIQSHQILFRGILHKKTTSFKGLEIKMNQFLHCIHTQDIHHNKLPGGAGRWVEHSALVQIRDLGKPYDQSPEHSWLSDPDRDRLASYRKHRHPVLFDLYICAHS